jgi:hypothetical protein
VTQFTELPLHYLFEDEYGKEEAVPISQVRTNTPFFKQWASRPPPYWGIPLLQSLMDLSKVIREKHTQTELSIEEILHS